MAGAVDDLTGKVAVVTGGTRGFGLAVAHALARGGASVVVSSRGASAVDQAVAGLTSGGAAATGLACDVGDLAQVEALAARALDAYGRLDVWVNNAGLSAPYGPTVAIPPVEFERVVQTNVLGTYHGSVVALRHFLPHGRGKVINVLGRGDRGHAAFLNAYAASKTWVRSFTLALAAEYKRSGVGVYAINPGLMRTDMMTHIDAVAGYERRLGALVPVLRLLGRAPEVPAEQVAWLASSATDGRTGLEIRGQSRLDLLRDAAQEGWRWLLGHPTPIKLDVTTIPPAPGTA